MELHPACAPLAFLVGRWEGEGRGLWAADPPFAYREEVVVDHAGKPFLVYRQRTWAAEDGRPMHTETGYLRVTDGGGVELLVVQPIGVVEIHAGRVEGRSLDLEPVLVATSPSARQVTGVVRRIRVDGDGALRYTLRMGMNGEPPADHLEACLRRLPPQPAAP